MWKARAIVLDSTYFGGSRTRCPSNTDSSRQILKVKRKMNAFYQSARLTKYLLALQKGTQKHKEQTLTPICVLVQFYKVLCLPPPAKKCLSLHTGHPDETQSLDNTVFLLLCIPTAFVEEAAGPEECMHITQPFFLVFLQIHSFSLSPLREPLIHKLGIQQE